MRIVGELELKKIKDLPISVKNDLDDFVNALIENPFDFNSLKMHDLKNEEVIDIIKNIYE